MSLYIHIVCLDAPSPPDYGGAIDMYFKIEALAKAGKKIILHYFSYKAHRGLSGLAAFCTEVNCYPRKKVSAALFRLPYIVASRLDQRLIHRLNADDHPILLEGLHCTGILPYLKNPGRVVVRMHNEEASYYRQLAVSEKNLIKKLYLLWESRALQRYQLRMDKSVRLATLSATDVEIFGNRYQFKQQQLIPCFVSWQTLRGPEGKGNYCLYHGNLSVAENEAAAVWLIDRVFGSLNIPFIIAGKGASEKLKKRANDYPHITLLNNPCMDQLNELIRSAQVHVLPSINSTGVKLKLLHALFEGRHVVTNDHGISGSGLKNFVQVANSPQEYIECIGQLMQQPFSAGERHRRSAMLELYDNRKNGQKLIALW